MTEPRLNFSRSGPQGNAAVAIELSALQVLPTTRDHLISIKTQGGASATASYTH
jgi:hypothetical protein